MNEFKIIFLGDQGSGKTSICESIIYGKFNANVKPTVGASFLSKFVDCNGEQIKMNYWDTAGQERYRNIVSMYFHQTDLSVFVVDNSQPFCQDSFMNWVNMLEVNAEEGKRVVVLNKIDLPPKVDEEKVKEIAKLINADSFIKVSAKTGECIDELEQELIQLLGSSINQQVIEPTPVVVEQPKSSSCC